MFSAETGETISWWRFKVYFNLYYFKDDIIMFPCLFFFPDFILDCIWGIFFLNQMQTGLLLWMSQFSGCLKVI